MKKLVFLLVLVLLLTGCADRAAVGTVGGDAANTPDTYPFDQASCYREYLSTPLGTYYIAPYRGITRILFCPVGGNEFIPLCGKPNCEHVDQSCNADPGSGICLGYYRNRLYTMGSMPEKDGDYLISMNMDGTDHRAVMELPNYQMPGGQMMQFSCVFHEGKLIMVFNAPLDLPLEQQIARIAVIDVASQTVTEPFAENLKANMYPMAAFRPVGNCIYDDIASLDPDGSWNVWRAEMNMDTGEIRKLFSLADISGGADAYYVEDGKMRWCEPGTGVVEYDMATGAMKTLLEDPELDICYWDPQNVIAESIAGERRDLFTVRFLSKDYQELDRLELPANMAYAFANEESVFFHYRGEPVTHRISRSAIGSGNLTLLEMDHALPGTAPEETTPVPMETEPMEPVEIEGAPATQGRWMTKFLQTEQGAYMLDSVYTQSDNSTYWLLYTMPAGQTEPEVLCRKPDCPHNDDTCDAWYARPYGSPGFFRDRVWVIDGAEDELVFYSVDPGTGERRQEMTLPYLCNVECEMEADGQTVKVIQHVFNYIFHENFAVLVEEAGMDHRQYIRVIDLPTGTVREPFEEFLTRVTKYQYYDGINWPYTLEGNILYAQAYYWDEMPGKPMPESHYWLAAMNLYTGETKLVTMLEDSVEIGDFQPVVNSLPYNVENGIAYYVDPINGFRECNVAAGTVRAIPADVEKPDKAWYLDDLIVVKTDTSQILTQEDLDAWEAALDPETGEYTEEQPKNIYAFFDRGYRKLAEVTLPDDWWYQFATKDDVYFSTASGFARIPRSQILSGDLDSLSLK